eukprot:918887-Pelagomonas_calceolata.AAC.1
MAQGMDGPSGERPGITFQPIMCDVNNWTTPQWGHVIQGDYHSRFTRFTRIRPSVKKCDC